MKSRIYKYDNVKALLIFLVVIGHMTTDYVSDNAMVRWITLWIYSFHMPAFIFVSGLVHKQYITEERAALGVKGETHMRWDKVWGFFLCGYALKVFLQVSRTLMGQAPAWHWIQEPGIPWYLFVMAEYEMLFYVMRMIDGGAWRINDAAALKKRRRRIILSAFALSACIGYIPAVGDTFCLSRMINFLPIYALGYYMDMRRFLAWSEKKRVKLMGWVIIILSIVICANGKWSMYSWRKWFTGRRSYLFLQDYFSNAIQSGWWIRPAVWIVALLIAFAVIAVMPDRNLGFITTCGARTLSVYFWHRPLCYLFRNWMVLPRLAVLFGGKYDPAVAGMTKGHAFAGTTDGQMAMALLVYFLIGAAMTAVFSFKIFEHPTADLMKLGRTISVRIAENPKIKQLKQNRTDRKQSKRKSAGK